MLTNNIELIKLNKNLKKIENYFPKLTKIDLGITNIINDTLAKTSSEVSILDLKKMLQENHKNHLILVDDVTEKCKYVSSDLSFWRELENNINSYDLNIINTPNFKEKKILMNKVIKEIMDSYVNDDTIDKRISIENSSESYKILIKLIAESQSRDNQLKNIDFAIITILREFLHRRFNNQQEIKYIDFLDKLGAYIYNFVVSYALKDIFHLAEKKDPNLKNIISDILNDLEGIKMALLANEFKPSSKLFDLLITVFKKIDSKTIDLERFFSMEYNPVVGYISINMIFSLFEFLKNICDENIQIIGEEIKKLIFSKEFIFGLKKHRKLYNVKIGANIARKLFDKGIIKTISEKEVSDKSLNKNIPLILMFNEEYFLFDDTIKLPCLFPGKVNSFEKVHNNYYITGEILDKELIRNLEINNKFVLNLKVVNEFLKNIIFVLSKNDEQLKDSEIYDQFLIILSEIYNINFIELYRNILRSNKKKDLEDFYYIIKLASDLFNFNAITDLNKIKFNYKILKVIINKVINYKFVNKHVLEQLVIFKYFKYFHFNLFNDSRGRLYYEGYGLNPQSSSNYCNLLSLFKQKNLQEYFVYSGVVDSFEKKRLEENLLKNIWDSLQTTLKVKETNLKELVENVDEKSIKKRLRKLFYAGKIKLGEFHKFCGFYIDLISFLINPYEYRFISYYGLDSSSSGTQIHANLFKDLDLAKFCFLSEPSQDIYLAHIEELKVQHNKIKKIVTKFNNNLVAQLSSIENNYIDRKGLLDNAGKFIEIYYADLFAFRETIWKEFELSGLTEKDLIGYKYLLSKKEVVLDKEFVNLLLIEKIYKLSNLLTENIWLDKIIYDRKSCKSQILSWSYGGKSLGRIEQYKEYLEKESLKNGYLLSNEQHLIYNNIIKKLERYLIFWLNENVQGCMRLKKFASELSKILKKNNFDLVIDNEFFRYVINPKKRKVVKLHLGLQKDKKSTFSKVSTRILTDIFDSKLFSSTFVANYVQSLDAYINYLILRESFKAKIKVVSNHDSFKTEMVYSLNLKVICLKAYKDFLDKDFLVKHFSKNILLTEKIGKTKKTNQLFFLIDNSAGKLSPDLLNCDKFVKL